MQKCFNAPIKERLTRSAAQCYSAPTPKACTLPSLAVRVLQKFSPPLQWPTLSTKKPLPQKVRGGSVVMKLASAKRLHLLDINSLYPFCFLNSLPKGRPWPSFYANNPGKITFVEATIFPPNYIKPSIAPFTNVFFSPSPGIYLSKEVSRLEAQGSVIVTKKYWTYDYSQDFFQDFVLHLYSVKPSFPKIIKYLLNFCFGKLISKTHHPPSTLYASAITSYARIHMSKQISSMPTPLLYSDTDSIVAQHSHFSPHPHKLGRLKSLLHFEPCYASSASFTARRVYNYTHNITTTSKGTNLVRGTSSLTPKRPLSYERRVLVNFIYVTTIWIK